MKICEITRQIDSEGGLYLPPDLLAEMGLSPETGVHLAYFSADGNKNQFQEFLIYNPSTEQEPYRRAQTISLPQEILDQAGIPHQADVTIACADSAIVIYATETLDTGDMERLLEELKLAKETLMSMIKHKQYSQFSINHRDAE